MKRKRIVIRDGFDPSISHIVEDGDIDILADDGRPLYSVRLYEGGVLEISSAICVKNENIVLDTKIAITPRSSNSIQNKPQAV